MVFVLDVPFLKAFINVLLTILVTGLVSKYPKSTFMNSNFLHNSSLNSMNANPFDLPDLNFGMETYTTSP